MFDSIRSKLGLMEVTEKNNIVTVRGFPVWQLSADISKTWGTTKIASNMLTLLNNNAFSFNSFYLPDFAYMLESLVSPDNKALKNKRLGVAKASIKNLLEQIATNTSLGKRGMVSVDGVVQEPPTRLDPSRLSNMAFKAFPEQLAFFKAYDREKQVMGLNGYLLAGKAGSGKTFTSLALAEQLKVDAVIAVVPKPTIERVWMAGMTGLYKSPRSFWSSAGSVAPVVGKYAYLTHYESLGKILEFFKANQSFYRGKRIMIILDECHNFNDPNSMRSEAFIELGKVTGSQDILWMSGTPFKALGSEAITLLRSIDPLFDRSIEESFKKVFGMSTTAALDILQHRMSSITFKFAINADHKVEVDTFTARVKVKGGEKYTLDQVRDVMAKFITERSKYYKAHEREHVSRYLEIVSYFERTYCQGAKPRMQELETYRTYTAKIRKSYIPKEDKAIAMWCNGYEKRVIIPSLPKPMNTEFKELKSIYKYVDLKIQGEALGRVLEGMRNTCNREVSQNMGSMQVCIKGNPKEMLTMSFEDITKTSASKTVFFTSYVAVVDGLAQDLTNQGMKPLRVHGETNKDLNAILNEFSSKPEVNPLIATFQSLSTGVPLIMASTIVMGNLPFRTHDYEQTVARAARVGQVHPVRVFEVELDTNGEPNLSTRAGDIMQWSKDMVTAIMGKDYMDGTVSVEDLSGYSAESIAAKPVSLEDINPVHEVFSAEGIGDYAFTPDALSLLSHLQAQLKS